MKHFLLLIACLFLAGTVHAQNPYESIGRYAEMLTLSNGQYQEFIPNDTLVVIGSVLFNTMTEQIVGFAETDTVLINPGFEPEVRSRFLSVDPYAASFPNISPYAYANNDPIRFMDPTGMYPVCGDACDETYQAGNVVENRHGSWEYQGNNQWLDLNTGDTVSGSSLLARYVSEYARASVAALGIFVPVAAAEPTPVGEILLGAAAIGFVGYNLWQSLNAPAGSIEIGTPTISFSAQDKILSPGEIKKLKEAGFDPEQLKGGKRTGQTDLYKKPNGDIVIKPKSGKGTGESTGINIKDL